jgi:3-isopropylmalate/(R)-2-methylmalate dehydratase small subunit
VYFSIDPVWKIQLLNGWDDIDLTLAEKVYIDRFRAEDAKARPWATPRP